MIFVERPDDAPQTVIDALNRPRKDGTTELEAARTYYETAPADAKAFEFDRYREWAVCYELDKLFHRKCAYCEGYYGAVRARDVEHYRPKGGVTECKEHPGYWWLALTWTNLLPSCPGCNRRQREVTYEPGMTSAEIEELLRTRPATSSGKKNAFPVRNDRWAMAEGESLDVEDPLLINPCKRDPAPHLRWTFYWDKQKELWHADEIFSYIQPVKGGDAEDPYGKASIDVYGLNRVGLVLGRMQRLKDIQLACLNVVSTWEDIVDASQDRHAELKAKLRKRRKTLKTAAGTERHYSAMMAAFFSLFDKELRAYARRLQGEG